MIVETAIGLAMVSSVAMTLTEDYRANRREIKEIKYKWNILMDSIAKENKLCQTYTMLEVIKKHYGFDTIMSLPLGKSIVEFRKLLPVINQCFGSETIAELSKDNTSVYMRVRFLGNEISDKDNIRFMWYKLFNDGNKVRNSFGETFKITKMENILKPNTEDIVGYRLHVMIPTGLNFDDLESCEDQIGKTIGKCFIRWNFNSNLAEVEIITVQLQNNVEFTPIACKPWELYCCITNSYKPIMLDFKSSPFAIVGGQNGSGKTVLELAPMINLATQYNESEVVYTIGMVSAKQDLRILSLLPNTKYYAKDLKSSLSLMRYLIKETERRNRSFENCDRFITNIFEYNKSNKDKLPLIYFITDEITDYMPEDYDTKQDKSDKKEFMSLFWKLCRTGRSAGVWAIISTQRGDTKSLGGDGNIKSQMGNKLCMYQPNYCSAQTIMGENNALRVMKLNKANRDVLVEYTEGVYLAKTLFLSNQMMENILKPYMLESPNYYKLDLNGNILEENVKKEEKSSPKALENEQKEVKTSEKPQKTSRFSEYQAKRNDKEKEKAKKEEYLRNKKEQILNNSIKAGEKGVN